MTCFGTCSVPMMKAMSMAILVCSMVTSTMSETTNITTDQSALLVLKSHITHDPQNILSKNWSTSSSICDWVGVTCGAKHKRVTMLNLSYMGLTGTVPPQLGNLSFLVELRCRNNSFHGSLPMELTRLRRLKLISFGFNNLMKGEIPSWFGLFPKLETLNLYGNQFIGSIPTSIFNLSSLQIITLFNNQLSGVVPNEIGDLQNLEVLVLQVNHLNGPMPPKFFNISSMRIIGLTGNNLSGQFPSHTNFLFPNLEQLVIGMNNFTGPILNFISSASKLIQFDIPFNSFYGTLTSKLCSFPNIQWLNLAFNNFTIDSTDNFFTSLSNCKYLRVLELEGTPLNAMLPKFGGNLSFSLQYFGLTNCSMKGNIPKQIGSLSSLGTLKLDNNDLTGFVPTTIGGLQKLQGLYLNGNKLQGFIPSEICKLDSLVDLFLANNKLSGSIPECLGNLDSLRTLSLNSNGLNSTIPNALFSLVYILKLNLSSNSLVGSLPLDIENMKVVIAIDLSNNELSGNIPSTIGSLQNLINLSLAQNRFTGQIPTSFGELISIELMDLSKNNLSGEIPKSLEALLSLKHFNVSYNQLEGEIPTGGPFLNFSAQSFLSNNGLCGASRLQVLPCKREETHKSRNPTEAISVLRITLPVVSSIILILALTFLFMRYKKVKALKLSSEANLIFPPWRKISYEGLLEATNGFNEANLLGAGSFGTVYQGKLNDGLHVAIKVFNRNLEEAFKSFDAECELLFNLRHRNLIKILKTHNGNEFKALVLQFMSMGSLEKWLHNCDNSLNMLQRLNIMIDVASALEYLHHGYSQPVVHCDIKPSNILLDADMVAHVADFGISKMLGENALMTQTKTLATIGYMAPEKEDRSAIKDCLASIMDLALNCSSDTPEKRKTMKDVLISLHKTKKKLLKEIQSI
ncbi:putative receptor-like protein kinase At3g47110 [Ziziphus jujuba]|uniref:Receptor-like protein kinase At3g47110 n=1 Tax=Ziziphus jujuba TaxID=326968 RepID=A0ABM3I7R7_ZIZJJ|nr:putative receptor-like protein kinase At3g47110 [Ziziphus jujuba]